jgi:predicted small lipoprotein YifL
MRRFIAGTAVLALVAAVAGCGSPGDATPDLTKILP